MKFKKWFFHNLFLFQLISPFSCSEKEPGFQQFLLIYNTYKIPLEFLHLYQYFKKIRKYQYFFAIHLVLRRYFIKGVLCSSESGEWKNWLKAQHSENQDHGIRSHHFMGNRRGNSVRLYFSGLQNHCRWWLQPWN